MGTHPLQRHIIATCVIFDALASLGSILESQWVSQWSMIMLLRFCQPMPDITSDLDCLNTSKRHYRRQKQVKSELQAHHIRPIWAKGEAVDVFFISREVLLLKTSFLGEICLFLGSNMEQRGGRPLWGRPCMSSQPPFHQIQSLRGAVHAHTLGSLFTWEENGRMTWLFFGTDVWHPKQG